MRLPSQVEYAPHPSQLYRVTADGQPMYPEAFDAAAYAAADAGGAYEEAGASAGYGAPPGAGVTFAQFGANLSPDEMLRQALEARPLRLGGRGARCRAGERGLGQAPERARGLRIGRTKLR